MYKLFCNSIFLLILPLQTLTAQTGLLVVAHGADTGWNDRVRATAAQVRWAGPVATAFLMGPEAETAGWHRAVAELTAAGAREIVVVPLMVSSHGSHYRQVRYYAGEIDSLPPELAGHDHGGHSPAPVPMRVTPALDGSEELLAAVAERWTSLDPRRRSAPLVLLGHGPNDPADADRWLTAFEAALARLRAAGHAHDGRPAFLRDDAPPPVRAEAIRMVRDTVAALAARAGDSVTVMTVLVSQGNIQRVTIPRDLEGLPVRYAPVALAPLPVIARWIERMAGQ